MVFIYFGFVGIMFSSCCSESYKIIVIIISDDDEWLRSLFVSYSVSSISSSGLCYHIV
jgi:hypothetical protein